GGMGAVYEAEQEQPRRIVALKVMRAGLATPRLLRRFTQEAEALGRLQHPGVAQIYEFGTANQQGRVQTFFAMEFIHGPNGAAAPNLSEYAENQRLNLRQRLEQLARVADAVQYAHQHGVVH